MTVNIEATALSMPGSLDSLKTTPLVMHRITFELENTRQWYAVMREARTLYDKNWRSQSHVKRRLDRQKYTQRPEAVWFDVPDEKFATWCAVKLAVRVVKTQNK
jgi:hypothetical protein